MGNQELFLFLKECGCCDICCLRYFKSRGDEYEDPQGTLKKLNVTSCVTNSDSSPKRLKKNVCTACLGLFTSELLDLLVDTISKNLVLEGIECDSFIVALSLPISLHIRQFSLWLALKNKFGDEISDIKPPDVPLKEVAKLVINPKLSQRLDKTYSPNGVMINIALRHENDEEEVSKIETLTKKLFAANDMPKRKGHPNKMTRGYFERKYILKDICSETYQEFMQIPPDVVCTPLTVEGITYVGPTVFVAGRYRKLSRELSHSPWVLQGKRVLEDSIQEIIVKEVAPTFGVSDDKVIFSSSGREDVDVRCLGKGRPFVLEISDAKKVTLSIQIAAHIEDKINQSMKVSVKSLQMVKREELVHIKSGEEMKKKFYRALCILKEPVTKETLEKLCLPNGFTTEQITPIRVLHRRPLHTRPRTIYSVKARVCRDNSKVLILDLVTQAGTYIKELVHGEFGRTKPSLFSIIGKWIDIIALDVTGIDLNWPKDIDNKVEANKLLNK